MTTKTKSPKVAARTPKSAPGSDHKSPASERLRKEARATIAANIARIDAAPADHNEQGGEPVQPDQAQPDQQQGDQHKHVTDPQPGQGGGKKAARPTSGKKPKGGKSAADAKPAPAPAPAAKPAKPVKAPGAKRLSCLDAAALVIGKDPIGCKDLIAEMARQKLWTSPNGKTPEASLYAAIIREIAAKGTAARFKKVDRGLFIAGPGSCTKKGA